MLFSRNNPLQVSAGQHPKRNSELTWPQKVLVTRIDRIGDVVLTTPVFQALRRHIPNAWIAALVRPATREILEGNPFIDEVLVYDKEGKEKSAWGTLLFALALKRKKFEAVINFHPTHRVHWISFLAGIPMRIGYQKKSGWLLTHAMEDTKKEGLKHEAAYNFDLLRFLHIAEPSHFELHFPLNEAKHFEWRDGARRLGWDPDSEPYVVLNPGASCPSKIWPAEKFAELGDALWEGYRFRSVLIGAGDDGAHSEKVKGFMKQAPVDLTGKLTLGMLAFCLKGARLLISNDSGPVHIGVAVGTPVLSIFGRNQVGLSPTRWGPLGVKSAHVQKDVGCYFCLAHRCQIDFLCLKALNVEEVLEAVRKMEPMFFTSVEAT